MERAPNERRGRFSAWHDSCRIRFSRRRLAGVAQNAVAAGRKGFKAELDDLRERMRKLGMSYDEIAAEMARRYRLRPRESYRLAWGWSLNHAAARFNALAAHVGTDPQARAGMTGPHLCEYERSSGGPPSGADIAVPGWPLISNLEFAPLSGAVPCARLHTRHVLWEWQQYSLIETTELIVSELVINAITATQAIRSACPVRLWLQSEGEESADGRRDGTTCQRGVWQ